MRIVKWPACLILVVKQTGFVPGEGMANAGEEIRRRLTDVFRHENGEWRHDLRYANVIEGDQ